ncbi:IgGFc-binding protein [Sorangium sp. So ce1000]|uniref:IgGFc-binding protein n=1 Tax=Sorangium sp. So ce1000 TaxID=3133325 RepID=UPI003F5ED5E1
MQISKHALFLGVGLWVGAASAAACSANGSSAGAPRPGTTSSGGSSGGDDSGGGDVSSTSSDGLGDDLGTGTGGGDDVGPELAGDPKTCAEAAASKSYIGCDFWPTVTANIVWSTFDYAVVVANAGDAIAEVEVTRDGASVAHAEVKPNSLTKIYLPWVPELKGPDATECTGGDSISSSVRVDGGAYHLVSTRPVTVYQFNALEYKGEGGPAGKDWSSCPGNRACASNGGRPFGCFSFTNDASLLLPSTAMTGNYRITGQHGWAAADFGGYIVISGIHDGTSVTVNVAQGGSVVAGGGIPRTSAGGSFTVELDEGDVVEVLGRPSGDLSGSLVTATHPVQVLTGIPCVQAPVGREACDHIEESVFPAETLGKRYFVTVPTSPGGRVIGHIVRLYGNVDGTALTYPSGRPDGAPTRIDAGQVVDLDMVRRDFEVVGDHEFAVSTFMLGAEIVDADTESRQKGDPSQSHPTAVEQYRTKYVFLAPSDYDESYVDIIQPLDATIRLDDAAVDVAPTPIGNGSGFGVARVLLGPGNGGAHVLTASAPVGIQVIGYGAYTSYQYPGGLNLVAIAPPPLVPQ